MALVNNYLANAVGGNLGLTDPELLNWPVVGDIVMSPNIILTEAEGTAIVQLEMDGSTFNPLTYPELALIYPTNVLPRMTSKIASVPYRVIAKRG